MGRFHQEQMYDIYDMTYPLVNIQKTMENHHFLLVNPLEITIFNSYVSLPEGIYVKHRVDPNEIGG